MSAKHQQSFAEKPSVKPDTRFSRAIRHAFVADSLAMPAHWYYRRADIRRDFPQGFEQLMPAPKQHPGAIMSLHSKNQGGRSGQAVSAEPVVGTVILKGKSQLWDQPNVHYHHGMQAGENTLNAHTVLWLLQAIEQAGGVYDEATFLAHYIDQMTADTASHPDTYAESYHRGFFDHWRQGRPAHQCAAVTHDTPSVGGLVRIGPLALWALQHDHSLVEVKSMAALHLKLTHPDSQLTRVCFQYVELLHDLWQAPAEQRPELLKAALLTISGQHFKRRPVACWADHEVIGGLYSSACYITDSWPGVLYLANKYADDTRKALQINTELGGDNVHRGFVLATILALVNDDRLDDWYQQLSCGPELERSLQQAGLL
jgi:hypothetical protein